MRRPGGNENARIAIRSGFPLRTSGARRTRTRPQGKVSQRSGNETREKSGNKVSRGTGRMTARQMENSARQKRMSETDEESKEDTPLLESSKDAALVQTYRWRWVVLTIFVISLGLNNSIWITFGPIEDVISCYYKVSKFWVNCLSMVGMAVYIVLLFPSTWILANFGLRTAMVLGVCVNAIGAGLRVAGVGHDYFWLLLTGQTIASICSSLVWGAPSLLSIIWFPPSERATATAIGGALSSQLGVILAFALGPVLVRSSNTNSVCGGHHDHLPNGTVAHSYEDWTTFIYWQIFYYLLGQAVLSVVVVVLTIVAFDDAPPTPPSLSRQLAESTMSMDPKSFRSTLLAFMKDKYFVLFLITSGINIGAAGTVVSILNEVVHPYFKNYDQEIGYLGIVTIGVSFITMIGVGRLLDWTNAFYTLNVVLYILATVCLAGFAASVFYQKHFWVLYITVAAVGATVIPFQAIAYEFAAEMTYPLPEGTSAGLINFMSEVIGIVMIVVFGFLSPATGLWFIIGLTGFGALLSVFIMPEYKRLKVDLAKSKKLNIQRE